MSTPAPPPSHTALFTPWNTQFSTATPDAFATDSPRPPPSNAPCRTATPSVSPEIATPASRTPRNSTPSSVIFSDPDTETPTLQFVTTRLRSTMFDAPAWNWNATGRTILVAPNTVPFGLPMTCTAFVAVPESPDVNATALGVS